jgi:hypothetical protein
VLREDVDSLPAGYSPKQNPILREWNASGIWIINIPDSLIPVPPDDSATLTIHSRFCPPGYDGPGETYYQVCDPTPPNYLQTFFLRDVDRPGFGL